MDLDYCLVLFVKWQKFVVFEKPFAFFWKNFIDDKQVLNIFSIHCHFWQK